MGKKTGTRSSDSTRRSLTGKGVGERGMALTGARGSGALAQVVAVRAGGGRTNCPESGCCGRSRKTSVLAA